MTGRLCEICGAPMAEASKSSGGGAFVCSIECRAQRARKKSEASALRRLQSRLVRAPSGCLEYAGARTPAGYGVLRSGGRLVYAHRLAWEGASGPIPEGAHVLHRCDNPSCCEPSHLFLGDNDDNIRDRMRKGRSQVGEDRWNAALTEDAVRSLRQKAPVYGFFTQAADEYGVSRSAVHNAYYRRNWKHVS